MSEEIKQNPWWKDLLEIVITVAVLSFVILHFILLPVEVDGSSMYPTLEDGQRGYSFIIKKTLGVQRFDIAVIEESEDKLLVKRVIGMPNETLEFRNNTLYINGEEMKEDFLKEDVYTEDFSIELGDDEYFMMGDNRSVSRDSRYYGPFSLKDIRSTGIFVFFPFDDFGMK